MDNEIYAFLTANLVKPDVITANKTYGDYSSWLVYQKVNNSREYEHSGNANLATVSYQFDAYAPKKGKAIEIIGELIETLEDYTGMMGTTKVQGAFIVSEFSAYEDDTNLYREEIEFDINYYEG